MRIGHGFDIHAFCQQEKQLILGGVKIPNVPGVISHSDGDVVLHAIMDALLGAAALGDIGRLFPDDNQAYKAANSRILLRTCWQQIRKMCYIIGNIDVTIITQIPLIRPYVTPMRINLSKDLECKLNQVNIKATTAEKLGFIGRKEGIACDAIILLISDHIKI
ncbi:MAG: 2-C-methyl-D-erythritol 2,4-cyclodiphosphate synthase [Candidatus Dasytiphilus stammeri]